jgi:spore coat protein U-like protein
VLTAFALIALPGCSLDKLVEPEPARILTSVELYPKSSTISLLEPLNTVALQVLAYDQDRIPITDAGAVSFVSVNELAATVHAGGTVSAVAQARRRSRPA